MNCSRKRLGMPRKAQPEPPEDSDFTRDIEMIGAQIRSFDRVCSQASAGSFPTESNISGLSALSDLESLADSSELVDGSLLCEGGKETSALVASILEESLDDPASSASVLEKFFKDLQQGSHEEAELPEDIVQQLNHRADDKPAVTLPLPSITDNGENALMARVPVAAAISEIRRSAGSGTLGAGEAHVFASAASRESCSPQLLLLDNLLNTCGYSDISDSRLFGDTKASISGVVDVATLATKGDLLLMSTPRESLAEDVQQAVTQGVSAIGLIATELEEGMNEAGQLFDQFSDAGLQSLVVLDSSSSPASCLAKAFYSASYRESNMQLIGVVGGEEYDVRTAAWLLLKLLESSKGPAKTGLLSDRRCMMAFQSKDVGHLLTDCMLHELLADMAATGVEACVVEVLPGSATFEGVVFDVVMDLGDAPNAVSHAALLRQRCLQTSEVVVCPEGCASQMGERGSFVTYALEELPAEVTKESELSKLTKPQIVQKLADLGIEGFPESARKADLVQLLAEHLPESEAIESKSLEGLESASRESRGTSTCLCGRIGPVRGVRLELQLSGLGMRGGTKESFVTLKLLKEASKAVVAALGAADVILQDQDANIESLAAELETMSPPPGTFEIFASEQKPSSAVILHEAPSPLDVKQALQVIKSSLSHQARSPKVTAVFGCDGEVSRGERAKFGWALASCDRVVLTSASPRGEPPMQILEDILEAVKQQREFELNEAGSLDVFVVADRADAIKQATLLSVIDSFDDGQEEPLAEVAIVFGSSYDDARDAADHEGEIRSWLCNDRKIILDSLRLAEGLSSSSLQHMPWRSSKTRMVQFPGRSLHWSYTLDVSNKGDVTERL